MFSSDVGLISVDNFRYLYSQRVLNKNGRILWELVEGANTEKTGKHKVIQIYAAFRNVVKEIKGNLPRIPDSVSVSLNDIVTICRTGRLETEYEEEGRKYKYVIERKKIDNIPKKSREIVSEGAVLEDVF